LGWDLTHVPFKTHYAFADACLNLLAQRDAAVEALRVARVYVHNVACACKDKDYPAVDADLKKIEAAIAAAEGEAV
jgi:uncharacterized protein involved in high-affinity Fe2+ transport